MTTPTDDRQAVRQIVRALKAAGCTLLYVHDGEDEIKVSTEQSVIDAVFAVDEASLHVKVADGRQGWVWFVLGNDPEEVAADYTLTLADVLDPLTESWWS